MDAGCIRVLRDARGGILDGWEADGKQQNSFEVDSRESVWCWQGSEAAL